MIPIPKPRCKECKGEGFVKGDLCRTCGGARIDANAALENAHDPQLVLGETVEDERV